MKPDTLLQKPPLLNTKESKGMFTPLRHIHLQRMKFFSVTVRILFALHLIRGDICSHLGIVTPLQNIYKWELSNAFVNVTDVLKVLTKTNEVVKNVLGRLVSLDEKLDNLNTIAATADPAEKFPGGSDLASRHTYHKIKVAAKDAVKKCEEKFTNGKQLRLISLSSESDRKSLNELMKTFEIKTPTVIQGRGDFTEKGLGVHNPDGGVLRQWGTPPFAKPDSPDLKGSAHVVPIIYTTLPGDRWSFTLGTGTSTELEVLCQEDVADYVVSFAHRSAMKASVSILSRLLTRKKDEIEFVEHKLKETAKGTSLVIPEAPSQTVLNNLGTFETGIEPIYDLLVRAQHQTYWDDTRIDHMRDVRIIITILSGLKSSIDGDYISFVPPQSPERKKRGFLDDQVVKPLVKHLSIKVTDVFKDGIRKIVSRFIDGNNPIKINKVTPVLSPEGKEVDIGYIMDQRGNYWGSKRGPYLGSCRYHGDDMVCVPQAFLSMNRHGVSETDTGGGGTLNAINQCPLGMVGRGSPEGCKLTNTRATEPYIYPGVHCDHGYIDGRAPQGDYDLVNAPQATKIVRDCGINGRSDFNVEKGHTLVPSGKGGHCTYLHNGDIVFSAKHPQSFGLWEGIDLAESTIPSPPNFATISSTSTTTTISTPTSPNLTTNLDRESIFGNLSKSTMIMIGLITASLILSMFSILSRYCPLCSDFIISCVCCCCARPDEDGKSGCQTWWNRLKKIFSFICGFSDRNSPPLPRSRNSMQLPEEMPLTATPRTSRSRASPALSRASAYFASNPLRSGPATSGAGSGGRGSTARRNSTADTDGRIGSGNEGLSQQQIDQAMQEEDMRKKLIKMQP